ncbi:MAG: hypothetical protein ABII71_00675 [Candidatus Micrarchaeota archaeon]
MSDLIEKLKKNQDSSGVKSYYIGLERGRIWAEDIADYFDLRTWSEYGEKDMEVLDLPHDEGPYYLMLKNETPLEWEEYLRGFLEGVKEVKEKR